MQTLYGDRTICYTCYRPQSSCMCQHITPLKTKTKFVILMHPKEFRKIKNGTGHLTHLSLTNSELFVGINFTHHAKINHILATHHSYILYPSSHAINLTQTPLHVKEKPTAIFLIDSTWPCSLKIMRESQNLHTLEHISFENTKRSEFKIKKQPKEYCLSTIESTHHVLELLSRQNNETLFPEQLATLLTPFHAMVTYQESCAKNKEGRNVRFKKYVKREVPLHQTAT